MIENAQRPLPANYRPDGALELHSHFQTIQGEGPFCGERAYFFRLYGCNLRCPGCDTEYTAKRELVAASFIAGKCMGEAWPRGALVVITGGEPLRQNLVPAVDALLDAGYRVQLETNGVLSCESLPYPDGDNFTIVCSPKTSRIHPSILEYATAFKYVLRAGDVDPNDGLPLRALTHPASPRVARPRPGAPVYVQPMDEADSAANASNLAVAIESTREFGHRLQLQIHKIINME